MNPAAQEQDAFARPLTGNGAPGAEPLTRRQLRELERGQELAAEPAMRHEQPAIPAKRVPPLRATSTVDAVEKPRRPLAAKGFSLLALTFAVAIAVATSVPATALLTRDDVQAEALAAQTVPVPSAKAQVLESTGTTASQVSRDGADVTSAEQVAALIHMRIANTFTNDPHGTIQWPFPVGVPISDGFGPRVAPTDGASTFHEGVDFTPGDDTPIQIIADGVVRLVDATGTNSCGVHVIIDHMIGGALISSVYCHMKAGSVRVVEGQHVKVADIVGLVGNTGVSTGAHLHFEIRLGGTEAVDPYAWLKANAN